MAKKTNGTVAKPPKKQSLPKMSKLASDILAGRVKPTKQQVESIAACVLSQDETRGN